MFTRERSIALTVTLVVVMAGFVWGIRWMEWFTTFHPVPMDLNHLPAPPSGATDAWFTTADGYRLHGWYFETSQQPSVATVVFFHGNSGNISNVGWLGQWFTERG